MRLKKFSVGPGAVFNLHTLRRQRQAGDLGEFEVNLVYLGHKEILTQKKRKEEEEGGGRKREVNSE